LSQPAVARRLAWLWLVLVACASAGGLGLTDRALAWVEGRYGAEARGRVEQLRDLVRDSGGQREAVLLERVNRFFNAVPYRTDAELWQEADYWATPVEMLGVRGGDCEDYAIAKYFTLRELGVAAEKLRITYVKALSLDDAHMVLAYYPEPDAEPLILDNLSEHIRPAGERSDLVPVYSFNGESLWLAISRARGERVGGADRIRLWNNLRRKMALERGE
jgi:predicted transglutaminase-like cysteine proteinase